MAAPQQPSPSVAVLDPSLNPKHDLSPTADTQKLNNENSSDTCK